MDDSHHKTSSRGFGGERGLGGGKEDVGTPSFGDRGEMGASGNRAEKAESVFVFLLPRDERFACCSSL